ncbi:hypothetical protein CV102_01740 [Natronococcus pandeyae]|uniref:DUF5305 domain-containing protein n=1 Tax=Natronococcus pandeyae TaxID=2055836 RepID=A0A8J8Q9U4_9EURY|nr:hypothetical protein CV102_01740 [Natronococcus pandeyae]
MISERTLLRLRAALDEWFVVVIVALLTLSLVGGWAAYGSVAAPDDEVEQQTVEVWSSTAGFDHGATVQEENEVFPAGSELSDRSVYFTEVSPELDATFRYGYDAPDGDVAVGVEAERVIRSVDDEDVEHWSVNETIAESDTRGLEPGEEHTTSFSVDVPETANESERIEDSLGGSAGSVETVVVVHVTVEGTIDGEPVDRVETYELALEPGGSTYAVDAPTAEQRTEERTEEVAAASTSGFLGSVAPVLLTLASICALGALVIARQNGTLAPSETELERVRERYEREEFDDWISRGSLPDDVRDRARIEVATLEDLVDVAIDCDRRVLEDERAGEYYVVDGESLYVYVPDALEAADGSVDRTPEETTLADGSGGESDDTDS